MRKTGYVLILLTILITLFGCYDTDMSEAERKDVSFDMDGVKPLDVSIEFGIGKLDIDSETEKLAEASFAWNNEALKPEYSLEKSDEGYFLDLQHVGGETHMKKAYSEWELSLNKEVALDLSIECGVGESNIDLSEANVYALNLNLGVGETYIDLSGSYKNDIYAEINTGIGEVKIKLPGDMGIRVEVDRGLGDIDIDGLYETEDGVYVNDLFKEEGVKKIDIDLSTGIGTVIINSSPQEVSI